MFQAYSLFCYPCASQWVGINIQSLLPLAALPICIRNWMTLVCSNSDHLPAPGFSLRLFLCGYFEFCENTPNCINTQEYIYSVTTTKQPFPFFWFKRISGKKGGLHGSGVSNGSQEASFLKLLLSLSPCWSEKQQENDSLNLIFISVFLRISAILQTPQTAQKRKFFHGQGVGKCLSSGFRLSERKLCQSRFS